MHCQRPGEMSNLFTNIIRHLAEPMFQASQSFSLYDEVINLGVLEIKSDCPDEFSPGGFK